MDANREHNLKTLDSLADTLLQRGRGLPDYLVDEDARQSLTNEQIMMLLYVLRLLVRILT